MVTILHVRVLFFLASFLLAGIPDALGGVCEPPRLLGWLPCGRDSGQEWPLCSIRGIFELQLL